MPCRSVDAEDDTLQSADIVCRRLDMISPMAVLLIMQIVRENTVRSEVGDDLLLDMEEDIIRAANVEEIHRIRRSRL